jgi:hypothetical protein
MLDLQHYKVENKLIKLIESIQRKKKSNDWEDEFTIEANRLYNSLTHYSKIPLSV